MFWPAAKHRMHILAAFLNHMAIPRARLSPADALFTAKFVLLMHELSTPNFATLAFYDRLFGDGLVPLCFSMTEDEVRNYGMCFNITAKIPTDTVFYSTLPG